MTRIDSFTRQLRRALIWLVVVAAGGCGPSTMPSPTTTPPPPAVLPAGASDQLAGAMTAALEFLMNQHDPTTGLLVESTVVATNTRWIATDNRLAVLAFSAAGREPPPGLLEALAPHAGARHGVIEVLQGDIMDDPIRTAEAITVTESPLVKLEQRTGLVMEDWEEYADLLLYAALDAANRDDMALASARYAAAMAMFDGAGFDDLAFRAESRYATYKNALAIIVGQRLGLPVRQDVLAALLASQAASGGFITRYDRARTTDDDANTETTALAVLALAALLD